MLAVVALSNLQNSYLHYCYSGDYPTRVSGRMDMPGVNPPDMPRTLYYRASEGKRSQQSTVPYHPKLTSSSVHHSSHLSVLFFIALQCHINDH